jgi:UDP-2,3-diacylglucosamine hydrolase
MIYFISDVHLGIQSRNEDALREDLLLAFLERISGDCEKLFIVGDLFDYWFEYRTVVPKYFYRTLTALKNMREKNIEIEYLMGNHDFGHRTFFAEEFGIYIQKEDIERVINGKKFYISHGDGKSYKDTGYKILKKIMRNRLALFLYRMLHPDLGIAMASSSSRKSRIYTDKKSYGEGDGMYDFAAKKIGEGFNYVIMGHRHKLIHEKIGEGYYVNLGEWIHKPSYATFDGNKLKTGSVREFLGM